VKQITPQDIIEAIESGEFVQFGGALSGFDMGTRTRGYCCLGVAAVLAGHNFVNSDCWITKEGSVKNNVTNVVAPDWAPWLDDDVQSTLADANDTRAWDDDADDSVVAILRTIQTNLDLYGK
jgi:hypothetical protein